MLGSGCGSVGRAVASNNRGLRFESSHQEKFIYILNICFLSTVYWKEENKEKMAGNGPFKKQNKKHVWTKRKEPHCLPEVKNRNILGLFFSFKYVQLTANKKCQWLGFELWISGVRALPNFTTTTAFLSMYARVCVDYLQLGIVSKTYGKSHKYFMIGNNCNFLVAMTLES